MTLVPLSVIVAGVVVQVRRCSGADLPVLLVRWPIAGGVHEAHVAEGDYLVAWEGAEPLGSGVVRWAGCVGDNARDSAGGTAALIHLHVRDAHRGRGIGTALVREAELVVSRHGGTSLALGVGVDNPGAARLYVRLGYQRTGVLDTMEYTWVDADGVEHDERETTELLLRRVDVAAAPARRGSRSRADSDEAYVLDLCDEVLGSVSQRQATFDWLRGDPSAKTGSRRRLPVDGYWEAESLVVEYRERQHDQAVAFFDKPDRLTVSGVHCGLQRRLYDERRDTEIPAHALRLVILRPGHLDATSSGRLRRTRDVDLAVLRQLLTSPRRSAGGGK